MSWLGTENTPLDPPVHFLITYPLTDKKRHCECWRLLQAIDCRHIAYVECCGHLLQQPVFRTCRVSKRGYLLITYLLRGVLSSVTDDSVYACVTLLVGSTQCSIAWLCYIGNVYSSTESRSATWHIWKGANISLRGEWKPTRFFYS